MPEACLSLSCSALLISEALTFVFSSFSWIDIWALCSWKLFKGFVVDTFQLLLGKCLRINVDFRVAVHPESGQTVFSRTCFSAAWEFVVASYPRQYLGVGIDF